MLSTIVTHFLHTINGTKSFALTHLNRHFIHLEFTAWCQRASKLLSKWMAAQFCNAYTYHCVNKCLSRDVLWSDLHFFLPVCFTQKIFIAACSPAFVCNCHCYISSVFHHQKHICCEWIHNWFDGKSPEILGILWLLPSYHINDSYQDVQYIKLFQVLLWYRFCHVSPLSTEWQIISMLIDFIVVNVQRGRNVHFNPKIMERLFHKTQVILKQMPFVGMIKCTKTYALNMFL